MANLTKRLTQKWVLKRTLRINHQISNLINILIAPVSKMLDAQSPSQKQIHFHKIIVIRLCATLLNSTHHFTTPRRLNQVHRRPRQRNFIICVVNPAILVVAVTNETVIHKEEYSLIGSDRFAQCRPFPGSSAMVV